MRSPRVRRRAAVALGAVRGVVAAAAIFAVAYILSWQILYSGPVGNDILYHLHLARWVDATFPNLGWWYRWDDHGIAYREGYPLAAHWLAVAISRLGSIDVASGMQVVEFATNPVGALGIYVFCAWRLQRPLAGLVAGVAYLLSPFTWTFLVDWGFFSNQAGTVLFMPSLIALDVFFDEWEAGRRGWRYRVAAVGVMGLVALMGLVSPFLLGAAVAAIVLYVLAITGRGVGRRMRWLLVAAPLLLGGTFLLTAFWSLPQQQYFSFIATRVPPRAFDPALFQAFGLDQILALHPLRPNVLFDRMALSPAVWLPAVGGVICAIWNPKARTFVALLGFGLLTMTTTTLDAVTWGLPVLPNLVHTRAGVTLVQFLVPVLAGLGVTEAPAKLGVWLAALLRAGGRGRQAGATLLIGAALALELVGVAHYASWVDGNPNALAYGDFEPNVNDVWARYPPGNAPPTELAAQLLDPARWRAPQVGCFTRSCSSGSGLTSYRDLFSSPPQRALVDAHVPPLLMNFRDLTGGSQAYTYNFQLPASPELDNWMLDSMLNHRGTTVKAELSAALGIDAVVLGSTQLGQGADYQALGWQQVSSSPLTFVNPSPSGLATEWPSGNAVLVVGSDQRSSSHPYNDLFERATTGMIPFTSGWLARGQSAYLDDYTTAQLARYPALILLGYRYHDQSRAWGLLDEYVRNGGALYVETGWQYVDPDWNLGSPAPSILPVGELRWGALDPTAPVMVSGSAASGWGSMAYGSAGAGWGASSAGSVRAGAESLVSVGGRVVVARAKIGRGRVVWSGMNLIAHDAGAGSSTEDGFVGDLFAWLLGRFTAEVPPQTDRMPTWLDGERAQIDLARAQGPTWVLFKESFAPGWSAELRWASSNGVAAGVREVPITDGELDMMIVRLDSVPAGAQLVFTYGPTASVYGAWILSGVSLLGLGLWVIRPRWFGQLGTAAGQAWHAGRVRLASAFRWSEDEG
jgi:hypothetical protein